MSTRKTDEQERQEKLTFEYKRLFWSDADFSFLENVSTAPRKNGTVNDIIITFDTETSKSKKNTFFIQKKKGKEYQRINPVPNYIVAWTISIGTIEHDLMTVYGHKPSEFIETVKKILYHLQGTETIFYAHNLAYDYTFLRRFLFDAFGYPIEQLNTKAHYPILIKFANGLTLKDSLILAQRSLDKWAKDLDVENQKAIGFWDYDMIRMQNNCTFSEDELIYIENDTRALLQCLRKMCLALNKHIYTLPYTATGIVREKIKRAGLEHFGNDLFKKCVPSFEIYQILTKCFHGGFTHANANYSCITQLGLTECYDFASSYPYVLLTEKFPVDAYRSIKIKDYHTILNQSDDYSFIFEVTLLDVKLKKYQEMPFLQFSKTTHTVNQIMDNGRITKADMVSIYMNEIDFKIICEQYDFSEYVIIENCYMAEKDFLPKWFTDEIYQLFIDKTRLKGIDKVRYQIAKGMLNSCYGMCAQRSIRPNIIENYETGDFETEDTDLMVEYEKYIKKKTNVLPYQWGIYVTSYATYNLFQLFKCFDVVLYSDTDSCYGQEPNKKMIDAYNETCKQKLIDRGYGAVIHNDREYWLGVAEQDGDNDKYTQFKTLGAKRYVGRCLADGELHLTVSGVPKKAVEQLNDNILNFHRGFIFKGEQSGKLTHFYQMIDKKYIDDNGNECADSIDLCPCDYELSDPYHLDLDELLTIEIGVVEYEDE